MNDLHSIDLIRTRYLRILDDITTAKKRAFNQSVQVVVVTKTQPISTLQMAMAAGVEKFGENYTEEALAKINAINNKNIEWHMIGHIQSRKAHLVANNFKLIHSVDSVKISNRLNSFCEPSKKLSVLLEVNVSGEATKNGFPACDESNWDKLAGDFEEISKLPNLVIHGLMTMAPLFMNRELARPYFVKTRRLQEYLISALPNNNWSELSMGTSSDYIVAVEEGATYVRIGEAILGKRDVKGVHTDG